MIPYRPTDLPTLDELAFDLSRLKHLRKQDRRGLSQEALAHLMGVSTATYAKHENGVEAPNFRVLLWLSVFWRVSLDELVGWNYRRPREPRRREWEGFGV